MKDSIKISRKTKSAAYRFIKSLMKDGVEGDDIHNLVAAISDNVNSEVGGEILADLIRNAKDENADLTHSTHWFGPISQQYFHWITESWSTYCEDTELRGVFRFGGIEDWKEWNRQGGLGYTEQEIKDQAGKSTPQLCIFRWYSDAVTTVEVKKHLNKLYNKIHKRIEKEESK